MLSHLKFSDTKSTWIELNLYKQKKRVLTLLSLKQNNALLNMYLNIMTKRNTKKLTSFIMFTQNNNCLKENNNGQWLSRPQCLSRNLMIDWGPAIRCLSLVNLTRPTPKVGYISLFITKTGIKMNDDAGCSLN